MGLCTLMVLASKVYEVSHAKEVKRLGDGLGWGN